jgi:predicted ATPase
MKLKFKNLGAIKEGEIDMDKRFYLFVGYNGTGKTYLSKLLFTVFHLETMNDFPNEQLLAQLAENFSVQKIELSDNFLKLLLDGFAKHVENKFLASLSVDKQQLSFRNFSVEFVFEKDEILNLSFKVTSGPHLKGKSFDIYSLIKEKNDINVLYQENNLETEFEHLAEEDKTHLENLLSDKTNQGDIKKTLIVFLLRSLLKNQKNAFYFPADRVFYLKHKRSVFSEEYNRKKNAQKIIQDFIENSPNEKIDLKKLLNIIRPNFTTAEEVLIRKIVEMEDKFLTDKLEITKNNLHFVQSMEKIMGGQVILKTLNLISEDKEVDYAFKFSINSKESDELPFSLVASAVNQLSTIYLLLKYVLAEKNNFLFIDEPEENLHPQNQLLLLNLLLEFANVNNNRVLIASHSTILADALNNYLHISFLRESKIEISKEISAKNYFNTQLNLTIDEIGVYSFLKNGSMEEYDYERYGVNFKTFNYEAMKIAQLKSDLQNVILDTEPE